MKILIAAVAAVAFAAASAPAGAMPAHGANLQSPNSSSVILVRHHLRHHRHLARLYRGHAEWFQPYAPAVPHFFPFGYEQGYF